MMARIYNDGPIDWVGTYRDVEYRIPKGGYIEMSRARALKLVSQFSPFTMEGTLENQGIKALRVWVEPEAWAEKMGQPYRFNSEDGRKFRTKEGLENYEESIRRSMSGAKKSKAG